MSEGPKILPANTDDPRFQDHGPADRPAEWTAGDALKVELTDPIDETKTILHSPLGMVALVEALLGAVVEMIGAPLSHVSPH